MASSEHMKIDEGEDLVLKHLKTIIHSTLKTIPAVLCVLIYSSVVTKTELHSPRISVRD